MFIKLTAIFVIALFIIFMVYVFKYTFWEMGSVWAIIIKPEALEQKNKQMGFTLKKKMHFN